jgi:Tol biopolymer transport system component
MNLDGTNRTFVIANGAYTASMPAISRDGRVFAFVGNCGVNLTSLAAAQYCTHAISPQDPTQVAQSLHPDFGPANAVTYSLGTPGDIMVYASDCSNPINLTQNPADDSNPRWAPPAFTGTTGVSAPPL